MIKTTFAAELANYNQKNSSQTALASDSIAFMTGNLENAIALGADALMAQQQADGHFVYELEADATIPAEYILLNHYLGEIDPVLEGKMAVYLRSIQEAHGGWPLFHDGDLDISASVKAYFALKAVGDSVDAPHMVRARDAILAAGGAAKANVFTRIQMALFGAVPWRAVPVMPVEIMLLPKWFPFHLDKISYWSRTVIVPLLVVMAAKQIAKNPKNVRIDELFVVPPEKVKNWHTNRAPSMLNTAFRRLDDVLQKVEPFFPSVLRRIATQRAVDWVTERLNGEDGLGGIYPAMANAVMMYTLQGYPKDHPDLVIAKKSIQKLVVDKGDSAYCQPCLSPVWDTGLACHALLDVGSDAAKAAAKRGLDWLRDRQILDVVGDWAAQRPNLRPGGWAFQYENAYYPDVDDTAVVVMAMDRLDRDRYKDSIARATEWIFGMQSANGGWGAFDAENTHYYLNYIPFADHGALLDPPTADVSARCLSMLAQLGYSKTHPPVAAAIEYLRRDQEPEGCWFGRWGTNYVYGTWSVLCALNAIGVPADDPMVRKASDWLISVQREDGGWGEDGRSYWADQPKGEGRASLPSQTAWAVLGLMAAGDVDHPAVARGIDYLVESQNLQGQWDETYYNAVGFPRVFYLRYHGYKAFFPTWALARYQELKTGNAKQVMVGM
jgi:squalene-hopene/tetraprenyl-beta-curcumene cyclase